LIFQQRVKEIIRRRHYGILTAIDGMICRGGVDVIYRIYTGEKADWILISCFMTFSYQTRSVMVFDPTEK
jgi:hypothetical protein